MHRRHRRAAVGAEVRRRPHAHHRAVGRAGRRRAGRRRDRRVATSTASSCGGDVAEASLFVPATVAEYCGWSVNFAERVDLGGASAVGMVWRAAAAIELGHLRRRRVRHRQPAALPPSPVPRTARSSRRSTARRASSGDRPRPSSTSPTATWRRTAATRCTPSATTTSTDGTSGRGPRSRPTNGRARAPNPSAVFHGQPITVDDVLGVADDRRPRCTCSRS